MRQSDVLIVGAGPTGLVLALWLTRLGVRVRVVDKAPEPGRTSRAVVVQARTLELYRQMDLAAPVVDRGLRFSAVNMWVLGEHAARAEVGSMGSGRSPFPYMLMYPQDEHEELLIQRLATAGVEVDRPTELVELEEEGDRVVARLEHPDGSVETCAAPWVAGCDGAHSFVRAACGIEFPGGTYGHLFYVADVEASGPQMNGELHVALDDADFLACFPLKERTHARLIGTVRRDPEREGERLDWGDVQGRVIERLRLMVDRVNWFSTYHVHHRVASAFRAGRAFLLGDAAHVHSPVGGQGMNTGIGDAVNLAWKLAATLHRSADARILDSYEEERVPFARRLVHTTDRVFELASATGRIANRVRIEVVPRVLATLFRSATVRRFLFDTVSQTELSYRNSLLSEGRAGHVRGGDRLPWVPYEDGSDNFKPLRALGWQVHVYGDAGGELPKACGAHHLSLRVFPWDRAANSAGLARDAPYLVRPDGYVALAMAARGAPRRLERYLEAHGLRLEDEAGV